MTSSADPFSLVLRVGEIAVKTARIAASGTKSSNLDLLIGELEGAIGELGLIAERSSEFSQPVPLPPHLKLILGGDDG